MIRAPFQPVAFLSAAALLAGCTGAGAGGGRRPVIDNLAVGTDSGGDPCTLQYRWNDAPAREGVSRSYSISCSQSAGRAVGTVRVTLEPVAEDVGCGAPLGIVIAGIGRAEARRCADPEVGANAVQIRFRHGNLHYRGVSDSTAIGPLQTSLVAAALQPVETVRPVPVAFKVADVPVFAGGTAVAGGAVTNSDGLLRSGIARNRLGLYLDASRDLNAAIGRLGPETRPALRTELELEAGLADSNISAPATAETHFRAARDLLRMAEARNNDRYLVLVNKLRVYEALDRLNQRNWAGALDRLDQLDPLADAGSAAGPATSTPSAAAPRAAGTLISGERVQRDLNALQVRSSEAGRALANVAAEREIRTLEIQADRARSVARLAQNQRAEAATAIEAARARYQALEAGGSRGNVRWLIALIERQRARVAARAGTREGFVEASAAAGIAVASFAEASRESGYQVSQAEAEARIDHARYMALAGADKKDVVAEYESAVGALAESGALGLTVLPGIESYLDLLVADAKAGVADAPDRFFRVVQVLGKPAIARQTADIQNIVNEDPAIAGKIRQRLQNLGEIRRISNALADVEGGAALPEGSTLAGLQEQRQQLELANRNIAAVLDENNKFRAIDDSPVSLAELRDTVLRPGEVYLKLTSLPLGGTYGIAIGRDRSVIYKAKLGTAQLNTIARRLRSSIDKDAPYEVAGAYGLFNVTTGDAAEMLTAASTQRIIVDPAGPLEIVPLAVLVTDQASGLWYAQHRKLDSADFSQVSFVAARAEISTALGPRSFMITRSFKPITAGRPFLGLGQHAPPVPASEAAELATMEKRAVCAPALDAYRQIWNLQPISDRELSEAARALGDPDAKEITGAAFTDTALLADPEVGQARVIHFATHGLPEIREGCIDIPPSLVTSLGTAGSDGLLSFDEIARLRLNANLVFLSACDTAGTISEQTSRRSGVEGGALAGLVRSFLAAEARAVIATYWKIPATEQSEQLLAAFYASGRTHDIGTALRDAQLSLIRTPKYSHPYNWGAFFLVGDGSKTMLGNVAVASGPAAGTRVASR